METGQVYLLPLPSGRSRLVQVTGPLEIKGGITGFRLLPGFFAKPPTREEVEVLVQGQKQRLFWRRSRRLTTRPRFLRVRRWDRFECLSA